MSIKEITKRYNHKLSQDLIKKALKDTEDWYSEGVKENTIALLNMLTERN